MSRVVYRIYVTALLTVFRSFLLCAGAGSAGLGVCAQILDGLRNEGLSTEEARKKFVVFSHKGVLGEL